MFNEGSFPRTAGSIFPRPNLKLLKKLLSKACGTNFSESKRICSAIAVAVTTLKPIPLPLHMGSGQRDLAPPLTRVPLAPRPSPAAPPASWPPVHGSAVCRHPCRVPFLLPPQAGSAVAQRTPAGVYACVLPGRCCGALLVAWEMCRHSPLELSSAVVVFNASTHLPSCPGVCDPVGVLSQNVFSTFFHEYYFFDIHIMVISHASLASWLVPANVENWPAPPVPANLVSTEFLANIVGQKVARCTIFPFLSEI